MAIGKDAYYFPHFSGARNDRKVKRLRKELGAEGYGIYFMILETLRDQADFRYPMSDIDLLADDFTTSEQKVRVVICNYQLFEVDDNSFFWSPKFTEFLTPYMEKSERGRVAARARWDKEKSLHIVNQQTNNANAMQMHMQMESKCNADQNTIIREDIIREDKRIDKKGNKFSKPTEQELISKFSEKLNASEAEHQARKFLNHYESNGWKVGKNAMKSWQHAVNNWITNKNQFTSGTNQQQHKSNPLASFNRFAEKAIEANRIISEGQGNGGDLFTEIYGQPSR